MKTLKTSAVLQSWVLRGNGFPGGSPKFSGGFCVSHQNLSLPSGMTGGFSASEDSVLSSNMVGAGFPDIQANKSSTTAGCPTIHLDSDSIYT